MVYKTGATLDAYDAGGAMLGSEVCHALASSDGGAAGIPNVLPADTRVVGAQQPRVRRQLVERDTTRDHAAMETTPPVAGYLAMTEGFMGAADRLHVALRNWTDPNATFIPLFETLNWLVAIDDRLRSEGHEWNERAFELMSALRYVRGRVHHQWAEAFELRDDLRFEPVWLGIAPTPDGPQSVVYDPPEIYTDWCWRDVSELPLADNPRYERGMDKYAELLAGKPVRQVIGRVRDGFVTNLWMAYGGDHWPPAETA